MEKMPNIFGGRLAQDGGRWSWGRPLRGQPGSRSELRKKKIQKRQHKGAKGKSVELNFSAQLKRQSGDTTVPQKNAGKSSNEVGNTLLK